MKWPDSAYCRYSILSKHFMSKTILEQAQFIHGLLSETREDFRKAFLEIAKSDNRKDRRKFVALYANLHDFIMPKHQQEKGDEL